MTTKQPEALRLADLLEVNHHEPLVERAAAAELRRQHQANVTQMDVLLLWKKYSDEGCSADEWEQLLRNRNAILKEAGNV